MDGSGKLYYPSGKLAYDGKWSSNQFDIYGSVFNENPTQFTYQFNY